MSIKNLEAQNELNILCKTITPEVPQVNEKPYMMSHEGRGTYSVPAVWGPFYWIPQNINLMKDFTVSGSNGDATYTGETPFEANIVYRIQMGALPGFPGGQPVDFELRKNGVAIAGSQISGYIPLVEEDHKHITVSGGTLLVKDDIVSVWLKKDSGAVSYETYGVTASITAL